MPFLFVFTTEIFTSFSHKTLQNLHKLSQIQVYKIDKTTTFLVTRDPFRNARVTGMTSICLQKRKNQQQNGRRIISKKKTKTPIYAKRATRISLSLSFSHFLSREFRHD